MNPLVGLVVVVLLLIPARGYSADQQTAGPTAPSVPIQSLNTGTMASLTSCAVNQSVVVEPPRNLLYRTIKKGIDGRVVRKVWIFGALLPTVNIAGQAGDIDATWAG